MTIPRPVLSTRSMQAGRWCLTVRRYRASTTYYSSGGQRTPGPWWALTIRRIGEFVLSHDRTIFRWDNQP